MTMPFGEKAAVIGGRKATQQITVLAGGAPAASPSPGGDYLTRLLADALYAPVNHSHPWSAITATPTTLAGYGITDAQPASAELTAIAGLSSPGYVKRTGPGAYSVVASIPQADVAGGPFLPLAAGAANPLTGELYAAQGVRAGSNMLLRDLVGVAGFGAVYGTTNSPTDANYLLAFQADASEAYFNATSKIGLDINGNDMVLATSSGVDLAGTLTTDLSTGFVRSVGGTLSASALLASEIPDMDASKIVSGTLPDARIASAAVWNAKEPGITAGTTAQYWRGDKTWQTLNTTAVAEGTRLYYTDARARAAISGSAPISYSSSTGVISHLATDGNLHVPATSTTNNGRFLKAGSTAGSIAWASLTYSDLTGTVPTWNQNTTGSAAKWTTGRTVSATGDASWSVSLDGSANVSAALTLASIITAGGPIGSASVVPVVTWDAKGRLTAVSSAAITPAAIGALAAGGTAVNSSALGGVALDYFVRGNGAGPYGHRTTNVSSFNTLLPSGFYDNVNGISPLTTGWTHMIRSAHSDPASGSATWSFDIAANFYTPVNGQQEGYYVRVNEGSNWGTWRTLWHSGNLSASTLPGGPYLPTAAGSVHSPGAYSNTGPTLLIGDWQYGLSANGGNLQLWAAPGGYVSTTANLWANGAIGSGVSLSAGGGIMHAYNSGAYGIWGTGVSSNNSTYSMAADNNGAWTWINGTSKSGLVVGGVERAVASASGLAVTGSLSATGALSWGGGGAIGSSANVVQGENSTRTIETAAWTSALPSGFYVSSSAGTTPSGGWCHMIAGRYTDTGSNYQSQIATDFWNDRVWFRRIENGSVKSWREFWHSGSTAITAGAAHMGNWVQSGDYARVGHSSWNAASGFGYLQQSNGTVFVEAPAGQSVNLRVNGTYIASAESGGYFWTKELVSAGPISLYNGSQPMARFSAEYNPYVGFSNSYDLILYNWPGSTFAEAMRLRGYDNSAWFYGMVAPAYGYAQNLGNAGNRWNNLYVDGIQLGDSCQLTNNGTSVLEISQTTELPVPTPGKMLFVYASAVPTNTYLQAPAGYALIYSVGASIESAAAIPFNGRACIAIGVARYNKSNAWFIIV